MKQQQSNVIEADDTELYFNIIPSKQNNKQYFTLFIDEVGTPHMEYTNMTFKEMEQLYRVLKETVEYYKKEMK